MRTRTRAGRERDGQAHVERSPPIARGADVGNVSNRDCHAGATSVGRRGHSGNQRRQEDVGVVVLHQVTFAERRKCGTERQSHRWRAEARRAAAVQTERCCAGGWRRCIGQAACDSHCSCGRGSRPRPSRCSTGASGERRQQQRLQQRPGAQHQCMLRTRRAWESSPAVGEQRPRSASDEQTRASKNFVSCRPAYTIRARGNAFVRV